MQEQTRGPRKGASALEFRSSELRASAEEGVIEGYIAKWGQVDSYGTVFDKGAFTKTLRERANKIRALWNHEDEVIGKPFDLREDDIGLFGRIKLVLSVQRARETYELAKADAIDGFSFGFKTIADAWVGGVRHIKEVALYEISPVIFPANENAEITGVRNMPNPTEFRAEDFAATYQQCELGRRGYLLMSVLEQTLSDIWWGGASAEETKAKIGDCLAQFSAAYAQYADEVTATWAGAMEGRSLPDISEISRAMREAIQSQRHNSPEALAASTSLTATEVRALMRGEIGVAPAKLSELPEGVRKAYAKRRAEVLEQVCAELRAGLSQAEKDRLAGLLGMHAEYRAAPEQNDAVSILERFSAEIRAATKAYKVGDRVQVKTGKQHDNMTKEATGTVQEISTEALGIKFDDMEKIHRWYVASELKPAP